MYNIEVNNKIKLIEKAFHRLNIWHNEEESIGFSKIGWKFAYLLFYVSFAISMVLGGLFSDNWNESIFLVSGGISASVVTIKLFYIISKAKEIRALIEDIGAHCVADYVEFITATDKVKNLMKFSSSYMVLVNVNCGIILTFSLPIFSSGKNLPLPIWFPFDWKNNAIVYWLAYAFVSFGIIFSVYTILVTIIIWYLMMNCAIKYQILGSCFKNIFLSKSRSKPKRKQIISKEQEEKTFLEEFIGLIKSHQNIEETIDRFKSCFENLFFAQMTTSAICICGSVYVLAFGSPDETLIQRIFYIVFLVYNIFDIFMVMHFGNEIKLSSYRLSYCLFESDWFERSRPCKKCIIILTEVLQKPHELVIGKLYPLDLETFTSIANSAYSMFNLLQNLK